MLPSDRVSGWPGDKHTEALDEPEENDNYLGWVKYRESNPDPNAHSNDQHATEEDNHIDDFEGEKEGIGASSDLIFHAEIIQFKDTLKN